MLFTVVILKTLGVSTPLLFLRKYIRVFYPTGQPAVAQIGSRPICASPLECQEHSRTALAGRVAINPMDGINSLFTSKTNPPINS